MTLNLVRVDDRLIHGQVIAVWLRAVGADVIVIVDDETAQDEFLSEILELAAPPGVAVEVYGTADAVERVAELAESGTPAFVLVKSPVTALALVEAGAPIKVLNIGGMGAAPGRSTLYKNVSASEDEIRAMHRLEELGTRVEIRIVPDDSVTAFSSVAKSSVGGRA